MRKLVLLHAALALLVVVAFWPVLGHSFTNYDDDDYVTQNPWVQRGLTAEGFVWALTATHAANWHPVTWLSHMLDQELFGDDARGHHATSLAIHVASVLLLFALLRSLTGATYRSALVAALFGVHPLHVESVAWIAERKDVLSALLGLAALAAWIRYARTESSVWRWLAVGVFALGLAAKPMLVTLPFVLLLLDWWPLARWSSASTKRLVLEKLPLFLLVPASAAMTLHAQSAGGTVRTLVEVPLAERVINVPVAYASYLLETIWPSNLAVLYPYREGGAPLAAVLASLVVLALVTAAALRQRKARPYVLVGWLWFVGMLVPVIGLVQVGPQALADRYTYLPSIGLFLAVVCLAAEALAPAGTAAGWRAGLARGAAPLAVAILLVLSLLTRRQVAHWKDSETLFTHALEVSGSHPLIHNNLGVAYLEQGRVEEAIAQYQKALEVAPAYEAYVNLGAALLLQGQHERALEPIGRALDLEPGHPDALNDLGLGLAALGRHAEAEAAYRRALERAPERAGLYANLGESLAAMGRVAEAAEAYRRSIELDPSQPRVLNNLGAILIEAGRAQQALALFDQAVAAAPDYGEARSNRAAALYLTGAREEAVRELERARSLGFEPPARLVQLLTGELSSAPPSSSGTP